MIGILSSQVSCIDRRTEADIPTHTRVEESTTVEDETFHRLTFVIFVFRQETGRVCVLCGAMASLFYVAVCVLS